MLKIFCCHLFITLVVKSTDARLTCDGPSHWLTKSLQSSILVVIEIIDAFEMLLLHLVGLFSIFAVVFLIGIKLNLDTLWT